MAKRKHSGSGGKGSRIETASLVQLELKLPHPAPSVSASILPFRTVRATEIRSARDDALKRILDFAESLPGK